MNTTSNIMTKIPQLLIALLIGIALPSIAHAESKELGWIERSSVSEILGQFGYPGITIVSGTKTAQEDPDDGPGWYVSARGRKNNEDWLARLWVSNDWKKGRVISCKKRE